MILYTDGGFNKEGGYGSFRVETDKGELHEFRRMNFPGEESAGTLIVRTNNEAEYAALYHALQTCRQRGHTHIVAYTDSMLMVKQLQGTFRINKSALKNWADMIGAMMEDFTTFELSHVPRKIIVEKLGH